jgi:1-acyl-sn-glycerol-3-phosphate acyltransferase
VNACSPTSPCDPRCLPAAATVRGPARARRVLRLAVRTAALAAVLAAGLLAAAVVPWLGPVATARVQRCWTAAALGACGVRVHRAGPVVPPGALVVANHVSWIDALALHAVAPVRLLAKAEVRRWPLVGVMAARAGTVFLDRDRLRALPDAVAGLADALRAGTAIAVFAEGTTRCGRDLGPFRPAALQAAHDAGAPVVPVAVRYRTGARAAFVGDDTLASSLLRVLTAPGVAVDVTVCPVVDPATVPTGPARATARRALARRCADAVAAALPPAAAHPAAHPAAAPTQPGPSAARPTPELEHAA